MLTDVKLNIRFNIICNQLYIPYWIVRRWLKFFRIKGNCMVFKHIILKHEPGGVGLIILNRPAALNALCDELIQELSSALDEYEGNTKIGCILITGSDKAFAAGADIKEMHARSYMDVYKSNFINDWERVSRCRKPVVAAVAGFALGGGCELAMSCDFIIAAENAKFGQPEINLGIVPGAGGSQRLARFVGKSKAMDMCLTGRFMGADEANKVGLVSRVLPIENFIKTALEIAREIASKSAPISLMVKECVNRAFETTLSEGILFERRTFHAAFGTEDQKEGMKAFIEKRDPKWSHR